jgi:hypothetical protein
MSADDPLAIYNNVTCLLNYLDLISYFFQQLMTTASFKKTSRESPGTFQERTLQIRKNCRTIGRIKFISGFKRFWKIIKRLYIKIMH